MVQVAVRAETTTPFISTAVAQPRSGEIPGLASIDLSTTHASRVRVEMTEYARDD